jgi:hypothetical protein
MVTINEWFETQDYETGLVLLAKVQKNRVLVNNLGRRRNPEKLKYELKKYRVLNVETRSIASVQPAPVAPISPPSSSKDGSALAGEGEGVVRAGIPDSLPTHLKAKWHENQNNYKEIRALHEKLKLMHKATDDDRKVLTERIATLDDQIRDNWETIDTYDPSQQPVASSQPPVIDHKRINANRKFISVNLKKLLALPDDEKAIAIRTTRGHLILERLIELVNSGEKVGEKTLNELRKLGVEV